MGAKVVSERKEKLRAMQGYPGGETDDWTITVFCSGLEFPCRNEKLRQSVQRAKELRRGALKHIGGEGVQGDQCHPME